MTLAKCTTKSGGTTGSSTIRQFTTDDYYLQLTIVDFWLIPNLLADLNKIIFE
jgi:hypothetical protein